jgi:MFS family permease
MQVTVKRGVIARLSTRGTSVRKDHGPLIANALMHLVNDGCFVAIYPVLPLMAKEFHLSYTQVGFLKTALTGSSTALQLPMAMLAERFGDITFLALGMAWVGGGVDGHWDSEFVPAGAHADVMCWQWWQCQHPVASAFVSREYEGRQRGSALGFLNFAGDLGKLVVPAVFALSLAWYGWRWSLFSLGAVSLLFLRFSGMSCGIRTSASAPPGRRKRLRPRAGAFCRSQRLPACSALASSTVQSAMRS